MRRVVVAAAGLLALFAALLLVGWRLQAPALAVAPRIDLDIHDVTRVEPGAPAVFERTLSVRDGLITGWSSSGTDGAGETLSEDIAPPSAQQVEDLAGLYASPGLTDLHVHYPPRVALGQTELWSLLLLAHGVTTVRETGSIDGSIFEVREEIRAGDYPGPRIHACGAMLDGRDPSFPSNRVVETAQAGRRAVAELAASGADCIKAYNMLSPAALFGITEAAAEEGLPVIGHVPHSVPFEEAGLVDLQHGTGVVVVDRERIGRTDFRYADWDTVDAARLAHVASLSKAKGIAHTPTLVNTRMRRLLADPEQAALAMRTDSGLRHLPHFWSGVWQAIWPAPFGPETPGSERRHQAFRDRQTMMTAALFERGVRIHAGTDTLMPFVAPGSALHGELAELVAAGIEPEAVWRIATREAGEWLGVPGLGTLRVGAPADLIFTRTDPRTSLDAFEEIEAVLANGRLYRRRDFDRMLAATDAHFHGAFYAGVMGRVVALIRDGFAPEGDMPTGSAGEGE